MALTASAALALAQVGCASSEAPATGFDDAGNDASGSVDASLDVTDSGPDTNPPPLGGDDGTITASTLKIDPENATIDVVITNGVITSTPFPFKAIANGTTPVPAQWFLDRGELGAFDANGAFTASGKGTGKANITARSGNAEASTPVTVTIHWTQNGGGPPGDTGVGGNAPGFPVTTAVQTALQGAATAPASPAEFGWLYPYDKTVWPRGMLAPLAQWQTTHTTAAVYIHLKEQYFEFDGFYSGTALLNHPIDNSAWSTATHSNTGDALHVDLKIYDGAKTYGPISEDWTIAPSPLRGTVYYDMYRTHTNGTQDAQVLALKPGATTPVPAIPGDTTCKACHSISGDGSTLIAAQPGNANYSGTTIYNLQTSAVTHTFDAPQTSSDGSPDDHKFAFAGVYPDGSFALANSHYTREAYLQNSNLFRTSDGAAVPTTGLEGVASAVTPSFSDDGRKVVFNYWDGTITGSILPGLGRSLLVMDFACGATGNSLACGAPPYAFSNPRQIYFDSTNSRYVGWPAFLPDGNYVVFHNALTWGTNNGCTASPVGGNPGTTTNCMLTTWHGATAEIWGVDVPATTGGATTPIALNNLNGKGYLPTNGSHPNDAVMNYEPTVNPIASGGYYWVVFTSRRMYGNVASGDPYDNGNAARPIPKKLWVAAIDMSPKPGVDPSHPAFYLPGQELGAGNMRGHWVVDPCKKNGTSCDTGDECCTGFCRTPDDGGALQCTDKPQGCAQEFEKCTLDSDCCGASAGFKCINEHCARPPVN